MAKHHWEIVDSSAKPEIEDLRRCVIDLRDQIIYLQVKMRELGAILLTLMENRK